MGKFIIRDNNYFFQPSVAIIYITFIFIFITIRVIQSGCGYSKNEYLINALRETQELVLHDLDEEGKNRALYYLDQSNPKDPIVIALNNLLFNIKLTQYLSPGFYTRIKLKLKNLYRRITKHRAFYIGIITFFIFQMIVPLTYEIVLIFFLGLGWEKILSIRVLNHIVQRISNLSSIEWAQLFSSLLSSVFVTIGVFSINRSGIFALRMFERSILVTIFVTEVFIFHREQLAALLGLSLNIQILIALRFMIQ